MASRMRRSGVFSSAMVTALLPSVAVVTVAPVSLKAVSRAVRMSLSSSTISIDFPSNGSAIGVLLRQAQDPERGRGVQDRSSPRRPVAGVHLACSLLAVHTVNLLLRGSLSPRRSHGRVTNQLE